MNKYLIYYFVLFSIHFSPAMSGELTLLSDPGDKWDKETAEEKLRNADELWLNTSPEEALVFYVELLDHLPEECEPFRSLIIMRLAQAYNTAGDHTECLRTLDLLQKLEYVPEHHALRAKELKAIISGKPHPGLQRTEILPPGNPGTIIYVNASAAQDGDGSITSPLITLQDAVWLSRKARVENNGGPVEIVLAPGTYMQKQTVMLSEKDRGLVIRSEDPENPAVLSGGIVLKNWKNITDSSTLRQLPRDVRNRVLVCDLSNNGIDSLGDLVFGGFSSSRTPDTSQDSRSFPIPELFYLGDAQTMARWPNDRLTHLPVDTLPEKPDSRYNRWAKESDLWLYGYWHYEWADAYEKVAAIDPSGRITLEPPTNRYGFNLKLGCAVNALCEVDQAGEWHLDSKNGLIHYLPHEEFDPQQSRLSVFGTTISAENCPGLQIRDLVIEYVRGDALILRNCSELLLSKVEIRNCSGTGILVRHGKRHLIHSCTISSMGRGGIEIRSGDWQKLDPGFAVIENCRISNLSRIDHTYTPALVVAGMAPVVRHNSFIDIPSSAIRLEACDALVELNYFYNCVYESGDQGAIDVFGNPLYRGNVIRWNDFDRIISKSGSELGTAAVRHDDFISGFMVTENIFRKGSTHGFGSVQFNKGTDNYVEGNIIIDWRKAFSSIAEWQMTWHEYLTNSRFAKQLEGTDWKSEKWQKRYPMLRDLYNGDDNHNFLVDNQRFGYGDWGQVDEAIGFANIEGSENFHGTTTGSIKSFVVPWHPIPIDHIGPYEIHAGYE